MADKGKKLDVDVQAAADLAALHADFVAWVEEHENNPIRQMLNMPTHTTQEWEAKIVSEVEKDTCSRCADIDNCPARRWALAKIEADRAAAAKGAI